MWQSPRESLQGTTIHVPGIAQELFFMMIMGIVYILLLFVIEYRYLIRELVEKLKTLICKKRLSPQVIKLQPEEDERIDEDVLEEAERIKDIITEGFEIRIRIHCVKQSLDKFEFLTTFSAGNLEEDALIVSNLSKTFAQFAAVKQLSFGVHHGECFGKILD